MVKRRQKQKPSWSDSGCGASKVKLAGSLLSATVVEPRVEGPEIEWRWLLLVLLSLLQYYCYNILYYNNNHHNMHVHIFHFLGQNAWMFTVETLSRLRLYCRCRNVHVLCGNPSKWRSWWELWVTLSFILIFNVQHLLFHRCYGSQSVSPLYQDTGCEKELAALSNAAGWLQQRKNYLLNMVWTSWHALCISIIS